MKAEEEVERRVQIIKNRLAFEADPEGFREKYQGKQEALGKKIRSARELLPQVQVSGNLLELAAQIGIAYGTDGHRADIGMIKTAKALAALDGRKRARKEDLERAARYVLPHRMRKNPLDTGEMDPEPMERILAGKPKEKEPETSREGD